MLSLSCFTSDVKLMKVKARNGLQITLVNATPENAWNAEYTKSQDSLPSDRYCAMWCAQMETCVTFEHIENKKIGEYGLCTIEHPFQQEIS